MTRGRTSDGKPRWLVGAARTVRSSGRLSALGNRAVGGVQGNRTLVDVATRVFAFSGGVPLIYLKGGVAVADVPNPERLPVVLVNAVGAGVEAIPGLIEEVAGLQRETLGFRPVLLVSVPCFREVRAQGWPMELVVPQQEWDFEQEWEDYLAGRVAMIATRYRTWGSVGVVDGRLEPMGRRVLQQLATYRPWEASFL
ncbi:hypothetical protein BN11_700006 [Nostocoides australiense Ben110]|uniref:Uncharacterized protein n=1 Tax=Nostocoides australiense Ben110 TaxID=1193182 RepID=W6K4R0_9MICO|nr:hypothetical protein [Tetrasphaera australiensis]MCB1300042.1 hypothetical protein [Tetrasphaera sp.]CCH75449.1 hypothetical protein BN11_700006 [Tetrasphaera australiensis Ben110]HRW01978.1 hypothetical protein [Tetrasphaera sp.]